MSAAQSTSTPCILHIWPSRWNLPSTDPTCVAAVFYLQLTIPGKFEVAECTNPDASPNGTLPFITYGDAVVSSLPTIISFVSSLAKSTVAGARNLDTSPNAQQRAKRTAWYSHVEANIGDLVAYTFYSLHDNFWKFTSPTMSSMLPFPQRYYVPERIRDMHRPRLQAAGLWTQPGSEPPKDSFGKKPKKEDIKGEYARAFERDRVSAQAKASFALYARLLNKQKFFFGERPTTLDIYFASHILLLLDPPFPNQMMRGILEQSFPTLVEHARNVQAEVSQTPQYKTAPGQKHSLLSLVPRAFSNPIEKKERPQQDETDLRFRRMRWAWFALAFGGVACYVVQLGMRIVVIKANKHAMDQGDKTMEKGSGLQEGDERGGL